MFHLFLGGLWAGYTAPIKYNIHVINEYPFLLSQFEFVFAPLKQKLFICVLHSHAWRDHTTPQQPNPTQPNPHTHTHTLHTGPGALKPFISGASEAGSRCASGTVKKPDLQQELRTSHRHSLSLHYLVSGGSLCMFVLETGLRLAFSLSFTSSHLPLSSLLSS